MFEPLKPKFSPNICMDDILIVMSMQCLAMLMVMYTVVILSNEACLPQTGYVYHM